jgi:hypothetical protein
MVAIHVLTAVLLSTAALKARAEPTAGFYDEYVAATWRGFTAPNLISVSR